MRSEQIPLYWCAVVLCASASLGVLGLFWQPEGGHRPIRTYAFNAFSLIVPVAITFSIALLWARSALASVETLLPEQPLLQWSAQLALGCIVVTSAFLIWRTVRGHSFSAYVAHLLPVTIPEYAIYFVLCIVAGFCDEYLYRGYALSIITANTHSLAIGTVAVTVAFALKGLAHGVSNVARSLILGGMLALPVILTGSLWPSIIAHTIANAFTGSFGGDIARLFSPELD